LRQKKIRAASKKRDMLIKYRQAVQEYKRVSKLPCGKSTSKISNDKAKEEVNKVKEASADKEDLIKTWEGEGFTS
jgi:hypothetical protein